MRLAPRIACLAGALALIACDLEEATIPLSRDRSTRPTTIIDLHEQ